MNQESAEKAQSMGLPVDENMRKLTYRARIIQSEHRAKYNFPTHTGDRQRAIDLAQMMVDVAHGRSPQFNLGDCVETKYGRGEIVDISYYNMPFAKELPTPDGKYRPKFGYTVDTPDGRKTQIESQLDPC